MTTPADPQTGVHENLVVVGVDGSEASSAALAWAAEEAQLRGATLKVIEAWHFPTMTYGTYVTPMGSVEDWTQDTNKALHEQVEKVLGPGPTFPVMIEVAEGLAAQVLLEASESASMIVVGSRGRGGFTGLLLGSVSAQVAHHAHCPVTIIRG